MSAEERIILLESKYDLKVRDLERSFETMCNLSQGLIEQGYEQGLEQGFEQARDKMIEGMLRRGKTPKEISDFCGVPVEHVEEVQATMILPIQILWDDEAGVWYAINEEIGLALESDSYDTLIRRVCIAAPEMAAENGVACRGVIFNTQSRQVAFA